MATRVVSLLCLAGAASLCACATGFKEDHYFQSLSAKTGEVTNYYRLRVTGRASGTSARYVSGYYDERAVDLFFNEVKVGPTDPEAEGTRAIFSADLKDPGTEDKIKPLSPDDAHGAFVMILSTNASSVARAIGQFAENQVVADAVTNLANREQILRDTSASRGDVALANASADEIAQLVALLPDGPSPEAPETEKAALRLLNSIARGLNATVPSFDNFDDASAWFAQLPQK
jgi:hypothetical protein